MVLPQPDNLVSRSRAQPVTSNRHRIKACVHAFWGAGDRANGRFGTISNSLWRIAQPVLNRLKRASRSQPRTCARTRAPRTAGGAAGAAVGRLLANQVELRLCEDAEQVGLDKPLQLDADRKPACAASKNGSRLLAASGGGAEAGKGEGGGDGACPAHAGPAGPKAEGLRVRCELLPAAWWRLQCGGGCNVVAVAR